MSEKLPWFKFFATDWISDGRVRTMSSRQKGWYIDLLAYAWQEDGLPDNPDLLKGLTSYGGDFEYAHFHDDSLAEQLEREFSIVIELFRTKLPGKRITHPKIYEQRHKMQELSEGRVKKAKHAADSRWNASRNAPSINKDATSMPRASPSIASRTEKQKQEAEASSTEQASSTGGVLNSEPPPKTAAAGRPARPPANGIKGILAEAFTRIAEEGIELPPRYLTNECGKQDRNPVSERLDAVLRAKQEKILAARKPAALARKIILDELA